MKAIKGEFVVGKFDGKAAEEVLNLANSGVGYIIVSKNGKGMSLEVAAVFRRAVDSPTPEHLEVVTDPLKIEKYNEIISNRGGTYKPTKKETSDATKMMQKKINQIFSLKTT